MTGSETGGLISSDNKYLLLFSMNYNYISISDICKYT